MRFYVVSIVAFVVNQFWLVRLPRLARLGEDRVAGGRDRARDAAQLPRQQALELPALKDARDCVVVPRSRSFPAAHAATTTTSRTRSTPHARRSPAREGAVSSEAQQVIARLPALREGREAGSSAIRRSRTTDATFKHGDVDRARVVGQAPARSRPEPSTTRTRGGRPRRGPARRSPGAWRAAHPGAFGGSKINSYSVWLGFSRALPARAVDWRRPSRCGTPTCSCSSRSPSRCGSSTTATSSPRCPLAYPPLVWVLVRCVWIARSDRPSRGAPVWPVWLLAAATVFLAGFRIGLNVRASNVIDVGYSGVIGADRIGTARARTATSRSRTTRAEVRPGRLRGRGPRPRPDERALRDGEPARRHVRAGLVPRVHPGLPDVRLEPQVGHASGGAL